MYFAVGFSEIGCLRKLQNPDKQLTGFSPSYCELALLKKFMKGYSTNMTL